MKRPVYRLLKAFLIRGAWWYGLLGLAQFSLTGVYWQHRFERISVIGVALCVWGAAAALNANSLVWRSLPVTAKDASMYRWWAMAGAPGIYMTLIMGIAWTANRMGGYWTPRPDVVFEGILAIWAVLGFVVVLMRSPAFYISRARVAQTVGAVVFAAFSLIYGVPLGSSVRPYSICLIAAGIVLLLISAWDAYRVRHWRWPESAGRSFAVSERHWAMPAAYRYGIWTVLLPLLQHTIIIAAIAAALVALLHFIFPRADSTLFWAYFLGLSSTSFLLTVRIRSALQPLRCLPLSTRQLAGLLLVFGALPGVATLGLALLFNFAFLKSDLDLSAVATFALIVIAAQALPLAQQRPRGQYLGGWVRWVSLGQRVFWPVYIGVMAIGLLAGNSGACAKWYWFRCGLLAVGVAVCVCGYFALVSQLRAGTRPADNEGLLYAS